MFCFTQLANMKLYILLTSLMVVSNTTWIGQTWIPPDGRLLTIPEIQNAYCNRSTIIIGDSLGRRLTAQLALVLKNTDTKDVSTHDVEAQKNLAQGFHSHHTYSIPSLDGRGCKKLTFFWAPMIEDVKHFITKKRSFLEEYHIIILAFGLHDAQHGTTNMTIFIQSIDTILLILTAEIKRRVHPLTVIWRTTPFLDQSKIKNNKERLYHTNGIVRVLNNHIRKSNYTNGIIISDVVKHLASKSHGNERVAGDTIQHFNNIARTVQIQCITHALLYNAAHSLALVTK